jgi:putative endonuclease
MSYDKASAEGERIAAEWMIEQGWEVLERNWESNLGELDIVARKTEQWGSHEVTIVAFVEVKTRTTDVDILPERRVDHRKRRKLVNLAKLYLSATRTKRVMARFDVIGVDLDGPQVRHYPAAFDGSGRLR